MGELSDRAPFASRPVNEGILKKLPPTLRHAVRSIGSRKGFQGGLGGRAVHRFWIAADELQYKEDTTDGKHRIKFGPLKMKVLTQRMVLRQGKLVDDDEHSGGDSAEEEFAADLTANYENLEKYFPCLARLRELAKLMSVLQIVHCVVEGLHESIQSSQAFENDRQQAKTIARDLIRQIPSGYPFYSSSAVSKEVDKTLSANGYRRSQVAPSAISDLENQIRTILKDNDRQVVSQFANAVQQLCECSSSRASEHAESMVRYRTVPNALLNDFAELAKRTRQTTYESLTQGLRRSTGYQRETVKAALQSGMDEACGGNAWVPAAHFSSSESQLAYGGVSLAAQLAAARTIANPPATSSYRLSAATLNAQRAIGDPYSDAVRMDNMRAASQRANAINAFWKDRQTGFGGEGYFRHGLFGGNRIISGSDLQKVMGDPARHPANAFTNSTAMLHLVRHPTQVNRGYGGN